MQTECILWTGKTKGRGYGATADGEYAHRAAYRAAHGEIPEGHLIHHTCGVKLCVNPEHLVALPSARSHAEQHRRTHCKHGHEFTPQNTWVDKRGARHCRICRRDALRRFQGWPRAREKPTHCKRGHLLSEDNVRVEPTGRGNGVRRVCRECARMRSRASYARRKASRREARE